MLKSISISRVYIQIKQIRLNVRFPCQLKTYFKLKNNTFPIDQKTPLIEGKASNFPLFAFDLKKQKLDLNEPTHGFIEVYIQSNNGKLKILTTQINFYQLKPGENHFQLKFENCPDKNAGILYSIVYQSNFNEQQKQNSIESVPMSESQYINWDKEPKFSSRPNSMKPNQYAEIHLSPDKRLNYFIQNLQKKYIKKFSRQPRSLSKPRAIESELVTKNSLINSKSTHLLQTQSQINKKNSYSDIRDSKNNNNLIEKANKSNSKPSIQHIQIIDLNQQLKQKNIQIHQGQEIVLLLSQKLKHIQGQYKRTTNENSILNSKIQRLQDKINAHKEKHESMKLSNQYSLNRLTAKQGQYQQQMKILTEKTVRIEYENQKIKFQNGILKSQIDKLQKKHSETVSLLKQTQSEQINSLTKKIQSIQLQLEKATTQNLTIRKQIEDCQLKYADKISQLKIKSQQSAAFLDQILGLKIEIEKMNSKNMIYEKSFQSNKILDSQIALLREQFIRKESHIHQLETRITQIKGSFLLAQQRLQKQKDSTDKLKKQIAQLQTNKQSLSKVIQKLNSQLQALQVRCRNQQAIIQEIVIKNQDLQNDKKTIEHKFKQAHLNFQNSLKISNSQITALSVKNHSLQQQITTRKRKVNELVTVINEKEEIIQEVSLAIEKFEQKLVHNKKINKFLQFNKISTFDLSTQPSKFHDLPDAACTPQNIGKQNKKSKLIERLRKLNSQMLQKTQILTVKLDQTLQQKASIQKSMNSLSSYLQKLHSDAFQQQNTFKGTQLTLQDKIITNQRLITRFKLIIEEKTQEIKYLNEQLKSSQDKINNIKSQHELLSRSLNSTQQSLQDRIDEVKKLKEVIASKEIVRSQVQAKLMTKIKTLESQFQHYKFKQLQLSKTNLIKIQQLTKNLHQSTLNLQLSHHDNIQLKQALGSAKLQVKKVNTLFVDIYKQINNIDKEGLVSSFLFIPLREALKKVQAQITPRPLNLVSSTKLDKQKVNNIKSVQAKQLRSTSNGLRATATVKSQIPQPPQLSKSPESKLSTFSKNSTQKRDRLKSKDSQKG